MLELMAELIGNGRSAVIAQRAQHRSIQRQIVDFKEVENGRQGIAAEAVGGVDNDLRKDLWARGADAVLVNTGEKALDIVCRGGRQDNLSVRPRRGRRGGSLREKNCVRRSVR